MRSIIIASLVALALASSPAFERTFEPKTDYHYKFDGLVLSGLPSASSELSQSRISARARIQAVDDRYIHLQLVNIRMAASHLPESEQMPSLNSMEQRELSEEYKQMLELPLRAQLRNGLISELQFDKEDAEWSKNMKRAVVNMISFNPIAPRNEIEKIESSYDKEEQSEENTSFFTNEKTLEGDCQVAYTVIREQKKTIITKSINFDKCTERSEIAYGLRYSSECPECEKDTELIRPQTVYTYVLENEELKESEVRSLYTVNVNGQEVMKTETRSKLVLEENHSIKSHIKKVNGEKESIIYSSRWEQLVEDFFKNGDKAEFAPFEKFPLDKKMHLIKTITEQIQEVENNMPETSHFLARLVRIFRTTSTSQLKEIHETLYVKADKKIQSLMEHALAIAGTKNTIQHILVHMENEDILPLGQILKTIQETPFPSQSIAEALIKFAESRVAKNNLVVRQAAWLAAGSVVRGIVDYKNIRPLVREDKRELKEKFLRVFMQQYKDAETTYEKILALKTIGNAGLDISVNQLNEIIVDKRQPLPVRKEAIDALRLLKDTMPRKIQKVLLPIYKNRQYEPEIRMLALWRMMHTRPEESLLVQVVSQMEKETNQQVAALTHQMIRHFAMSTNPCYQRVAIVCSKVLSFTRYQPQEQMIASSYAQLPLFLQNSFSGAQFDFAAIFEKNSFLPKDLHASLDAVFGGNWNKYFAQIGFSQQHMDKYVQMALEKLESLEKESTTVVRGRRIQTGIKLLKELAQKMNIRARPATYTEKDAFAMVYLRYKDMDYAFLPIDRQLVENLIEKFTSNGKVQFSEIRRLLNQELEFETHHAAYFYEAIRKFPTTLGLPLTISGKIPTVISAEGQFSLELEGTELRLTVEARPSVAATHVYEMRMFTPLFEQGVKSVQSVRAYTPIKIQAVAGMKRNFEIVYKVVVPENQKSIVSLTTRPVVFLRFPGFSKFEYIEAEERTVVVPQWQQKTQEIEKVFNFLGLEVSTRGNILNQHTLENWLLAEQDFEVSVENKNRPAEFTARLTVGQLEKTELSQIKYNKIFEKEFELEQENTESRREYFNKMVKNIQKEQGYKSVISLKLEAPRDYTMNTELTTVCDKQVRMCQWEVEIRRSPILEETKEWTLRSQLLVVRPEMPSSLRQLRDQPHREVQLSLTSTWGSQKKSEVTVNAQLQQSKEQKKYERNMDRQFNGMPEYELLIKAARLNQINAVAEYKLTRETEQVLARYFDLVKTYNYWTVSSRPENNENDRVVVQLTVEPMSRQYVNITMQSPMERIELKNVQVPRVYLPSIAQRSVKHQLTEASGSVCKVQKNQIRTFDDVLYNTPLTTCYSLIAKDCSEEPTFAVLSKKTEKNSEEMIIKVIRGEQEIVAQLQNEEIRVKVDGKKIQSEDYSAYQIERLGESAIVIELPEGEVRFDGYTIKTQLPSYSRKNQLCGLCGNNDDESTNEFYTSDNTETEDIEEFHRSYLLKNEECEAEEERLSEKKNYRKYERDEEQSDEYSSEETYDYEQENTKKSQKNQRSQKKSDLVEKTQIKEFSHRICFSVEPVAECRRGYEVELFFSELKIFRMTIKAVIFDMGGVILPAPMHYWKSIEKTHNLRDGSVVETIISKDFYPHFKLFETGRLTSEDLDPLFTHIYNFQNNRVGDILPIFVEVSSQIQHTPLLPEMVELIKSLRLAGYRTILITNNFYTDRARLLPTVPSQVGLLFDDVLESCRLGLRKPDTKIYELALERSKLHPSDCVFLDDLGSNLKSAKEMGITTIKVVSSQQAIHDLGNILKLNFSYPPETRDCIPREVLPIEKINELITRRTGTDNKVETIRKFRHGQSNPTYYIRTVRGSQYVLRKKPSGSLLPKAHQVDREFKIMNALQGLVPLPKTLLYDETTLDTSFYLMEYQKGRIFLKPSLPELTPPERRRVYEEALKTLATIHSVDYEKVGLQDFGRTDGYMARNLKRWSDSYQMAKTEEIQEMIKLEAYLKANLPKSGKSTIVHGDFRVDNLIIEENEIKVKGVLDWELSTIGDPLSDLATFLFVYYVPNRMILLPGLGDYSESDLHRMGIPTIKECLELYAKYTNTEVVDPELWTYYMAFVIFRFASIIQGVYKRSQLKNASSTEASQLGPLVRKLAAEGMQMISKVHASKSYGQLTIIPSGMSLKAQKYYEIVREIIQNDVIPLEQELLEYYEEGPHRWTIPHPKIEKLKEKSKSLGAWNLFISEHIDPEQKYGKGLTNVEYAHICELMGRSIFAPEVFNCQAPDTGNMEVLIKYGSEEQKSKWLTPLLNGEIKSCFAMTEPDVASSDATNIQGSIVRVGNEYIINARKWFISNASHPKCRIAIFMGQVSGAKRSRNLQQSMILVPMQTEGVKIIRNTHVFGSQDAPGGHPEITFTNVRVPVGNMLLGEGKGFEIAQGRLGPGRIHHAMRLIGHAERAIDVIKDRLLTRIAFGRKLVQFDSLRKELALSRCEVEQARLLVLKAAHMIDTVGPKEAKSEIAMIKVVAPNMAISILDRAMQQQGARGLTPFTPLASFYVWARSLRIADGPDAVHLETIAKIEMKSRL